MLNLKQLFDTIGDYKNFCESHNLEIKEFKLIDNSKSLKIKLEYSPDKNSASLTFYPSDNEQDKYDRSYEKVRSYLRDIDQNIMIENDKIDIFIDRSYRYTNEKKIDFANNVQLAIQYGKSGKYALIIID